MKRKLIEVSLPLEAINRESAREKSIRHGHPSTLHLWWARRPLAAARAVLFAQLVDDPSSRPDEFPTADAQRKERERLHKLIERLVVWENIGDEGLLAEARSEILKSTDGRPPPIIDPFAGGGTIPLEAQRLGLEAHASDLNPVAVLINKALIEIPPRFRSQPPIFPGLSDSEIGDWTGSAGLAADVRAYGAWMRDEAEKEIGHLYPKATLADGSKATVIAWIWARTVTCPNPACGIEMPLVRTWWLGKKKGKEAYMVPVVVADGGHHSGKRITFTVGHDLKVVPPDADDGTVGRTGAVCVSCHTTARLAYIREEGQQKRLGTQLMAIAVDGGRRRTYLAPNSAQEDAANVEPPIDSVSGSLGYYPRDLKAPTYGLTQFTDLFTARQLVTLTTFSNLVAEARKRIIDDGASPQYADAIATYLGMTISRTLNKSTAICTWDSSPKMEAVRGLFARQAIPMAWDFAESNVLGTSSGNFLEDVEWVAKALQRLPLDPAPGEVRQADAASRDYAGKLISTDPPYYDNIGYSDLSDFFYVWLRRSLRSVHPDLMSTLLVPKAEELVANPYRHGSKEGAQTFFEDGFRAVFAHARQDASNDFPITVWYAFKQSDSDESGVASTGWETLLEGMIQSGWEITSTWPTRSELGNRLMANGMNALASSIVLSLRPRKAGAPTVDRRGYVDRLRDELPGKLRELQQGAIAPVDLAQAAIGPGMAVFSRYGRVVEPDGRNLTVREALRLINAVLGEVLSDQEVDFDADTRWCVKWFETHGFDKAGYGEAETLAGAYNSSVKGLDRSGSVNAKAGEVRLLTTADLPTYYRPERDEHITLWEVAMHLVKALDESGLSEAGRILDGASTRVDVEAVKELAYLVFSLAEKRSMVQVAGMFNALVTSWPEVTAAAKAHASAAPKASEQVMVPLDDELDG
ncbi:MAG: DUF1156 domain-containing protein [Nocardioides sp.]